MKVSDLPAKQAKRYIGELQGFGPHRQLLIKVGGGLLEDKAEVLELIEAIAELAKKDIHILLVHGGGPQLTEAIESEGHKTRFIDGNRYTDETTLRLAKSVFTNITNNLVQVLSNNGIKAATIPARQLISVKRNQELGFCGTEVTSIATQDIAKTMKSCSILVVNSLAADAETAETLNINADTVFRALATKLKPHRITSLSPTGGVLQQSNGNNRAELISGIDVRDIDGLIKDGTVSGGMALKLRELTEILKGLEIGSAISITKPAELLTELLTDQGSGTFVGKGQKIITTRDIGDVFDDLPALIKEVFKKSLPEHYEKQAFQKIYFTADHRAFGIVTKLSDGTAYLDKLAVSPQLQGRGVGESLWYRVAADYPVLLWRTHATNRYATWYHRHADIMKRHGAWILFGRGIDFAGLEAKEKELVGIPTMR